MSEQRELEIRGYAILGDWNADYFVNSCVHRAKSFGLKVHLAACSKEHHTDCSHRKFILVFLPDPLTKPGSDSYEIVKLFEEIHSKVWYSNYRLVLITKDTVITAFGVPNDSKCAEKIPFESNRDYENPILPEEYEIGSAYEDESTISFQPPYYPASPSYSPASPSYSSTSPPGPIVEEDQETPSRNRETQKRIKAKRPFSVNQSLGVTQYIPKENEDAEEKTITIQDVNQFLIDCPYSDFEEVQKSVNHLGKRKQELNDAYLSLQRAEKELVKSKQHYEKLEREFKKNK